MNGHITASGQPLRTMPSATPFSAVQSARRVLRLAPTGGLATLNADGSPFASLVTTATTMEGEPLVLLSDIAVHTRNLKRDPRVSILLVAPGGENGDPLAGARLSVTGTIAEDTDAGHRRRFLARHAEASGYSTFRDFHLYRIRVAGSHLVAGFGRIVDLPPADLLTDCSDSAELVASEEGAIEHMNDDHGEALSLYATRLLGMPPGEWQTTGADPDGLDLRAGSLRARLEFPQKARNGGDLRAILVHFAKEARAAAG
jgi:putative heme iron utilization protein